MLQFVLYTSYKTGYFIITALQEICNVVCNFAAISAVLLRIIAEDFLVFVHDVVFCCCSLCNSLLNIFDTIFQLFFTILNGIKLVTHYLVWFATAAFDTYISAIVKIYLGIVQLMANIKYFVLLLGSGFWFAITFVPLFIVYTITMTTYYTGRLFEEIFNMIGLGFWQSFMFIKDIYQFITDVPFESLAGLTAGICISYIVVKFHLILYRMLNGYMHSLAQSLLRATNKILNYFRRLIRRFSKRNTETHTEKKRELKTFENYCIICQEQEKCMLILPCKHVCLCEECFRTLYRYNHSCPVCRSVIQNTMKIYV